MKYPYRCIGVRHIDWIGLLLETEIPAMSKYIAMYLNRFMNRQQDIAYPSQARMMVEMGISNGSLNKYLSILESEGWIQRRSGNSKKTTTYIITFPSPVENDIENLSTNAPSRGELKNRTLRHAEANTPSHGEKVLRHTETNNNINNKGNNNRSNGFDRFWKIYPKKVKKKDSLSKWKAKQLDQKIDLIISDVENRLKNDQRWKDGFIPDPTTYLNGERWEDEVTKATDEQGESLSWWDTATGIRNRGIELGVKEDEFDHFQLFKNKVFIEARQTGEAVP